MSETVMKCAANHEHFHGAQGSHRCYMSGKCRCAPCVRSHSNYLRLRRRLAGADSKVSALGARRRIHGLAVFGWSQQRIAEMAGLPLVRVNGISAGRTQVIMLSTHRKIADVARRLDGVRAPVTLGSTQCVNRAKKLGWVALAAWDDIDDPTEEPKGVRVPMPGVPRVDREMVWRLLGEGLSLSEVAALVGCSPRTVARIKNEGDDEWAA